MPHKLPKRGNRVKTNKATKPKRKANKAAKKMKRGYCWKLLQILLRVIII